jgi:hypothetical protein
LSYWLVAEALDWFEHGPVRERAITEDFARDSFENLLFGLCRFKEYTGAYPERLTMLSWAFKEERFHLHREACGWPRARYAFLGPNDPPQREQALAGEALARDLYRDDPYGRGERFRLRREERNPFRRRHGYLESCPELRPLLEGSASPKRATGRSTARGRPVLRWR